ncbi:Hypothetical predicted protein [Lecanosticta acicola]|uniref:Uncharacterized protein n=1 Tax=Lecanosticta acicola TaxID=111012 RepID=A0AAI8YZB8_9PEZI|nr:Hypothetical predicted protein [Lecanosticta acicola]
MFALMLVLSLLFALFVDANVLDLEYPPVVSTSSSSSNVLVKVATPVSTGITHNSANDTGFPSPTGKIYPTGIFPPRITTVPLVSVSGGYIPVNHNFTVPYFNPHCPGNATHIHHGTEPCDCGDDHAPTAVASSGSPVNSANATTSRAIPSSGPPVNSANATTSAFMTGTGYRAPRLQNATITTVPLTRVSGGYIPIQHNFTVPYFNPHCPGNKTHVHHGTEPCDCIDDEPTALPSSGFPVNSANATTTSRSVQASPISKPSSGVPVNSVNATTSHFMTGTAPAPTRVPLVSVSGGFIPINHNFTVPYFNT